MDCRNGFCTAEAGRCLLRPLPRKPQVPYAAGPWTGKTAFEIPILRRIGVASRLGARCRTGDVGDCSSTAMRLARLSQLAAASSAEFAKFDISPRGFHWYRLDVDVSIAGLLTWRCDMTRGHLSMSA